MSRPTQRIAATALAATGLAALAGLAGGSPAAAAEPSQASSFAYKCKFPIIGTRPVKLDVQVQAPLTIGSSDVFPIPIGPYPFTVKATIAAAALGFSIEGLHTLAGAFQQPGNGSALAVRFVPPLGDPSDFTSPVDFGPSLVGPAGFSEPLVLEGTGTLKPQSTLTLAAHRFDLASPTFNLAARDQFGVPIEGFVTPSKDVDGVTPFVDTDRLPGQTPLEDPTFNVPCKLDPPAGQNAQLAQVTVVDGGSGDAPSKPGPGTYVDSDFTHHSINLRWSPSTDDGWGVDHYEIEYEGFDGPTVIKVAPDKTSHLIDGLGADSGYIFSITAVDKGGNRSEPYVTDELFTLLMPVPQDPTKPTGLQTGAVTSSSVALSWTASTDPDGQVVAYNVLRDGTKVATVTGTSAVVTGLATNVDYAFTVQAVDNEGRVSPPSEPVRVKIAGPKPPVHVDYALAGKTVVKTLARGELKLTGALGADFAASGAFAGDLTFNDATGRLVAGGFLPITANIGFVPTSKTTGTLDQTTGVLTTNTKVRIKIKNLKMYGFLPLVGGNSCQTKSLTDLQLKSAPGFQPQVGGTLSGTYKISDFNGCGTLQGLVSPLVAGAGNTIELGLTPKLP